MRHLRATFWVGGLVFAVVWALQSAGLFGPWDVALHSLNGLSGRSDAFRPGLLAGLCLGLAFAVAWTTIDIPKPSLKAVVGVGALLQVAGFVFVAGLFGLHFPAFAPATAVLLAFLVGSLYANSEAGSRKRRLRAVFGNRLSGSVFRRLVDLDPPLRLDGFRADATALVCEIFHADPNGSEQDPAQEIARINAFLESACELLVQHGACLDACDGEGIRALFLDPVTPEDPPAAAVAAALALAARNDAGVDFRIGLETDEVTLGVFGSSRTGAFGACGPVLDFARQLARWNLRFGTRVLAGPSLQTRLHDRFVFRPAALVSPPICVPAVEIYEPIRVASDCPPSERFARAEQLFWEGQVLFREGHWHDALRRLTEARELAGSDPLCDFYLTRARAALEGDARAADLFTGETAFPPP